MQQKIRITYWKLTQKQKNFTTTKLNITATVVVIDLLCRKIRNHSPKGLRENKEARVPGDRQVIGFRGITMCKRNATSNIE